MSEATRAYIYRVTGASIPLLVFYGVLAEQSAPLWVALAGAATSTGLAAANTSTKGQ